MVPETPAAGVRTSHALVCLGASLALALFFPRQATPHIPVTTTLRFNKEIAPILNARCAQCHAPEGMAMTLQTWDEARPWAVAIKEEILARRMPPWPAERGYGAFANDSSLTPRELEFLLTWVDGGAPMGVGEPPTYLDHRTHWMMGEPSLRALPDPGTRPTTLRPGWARLTLDPKASTDTWVRGFDFKTNDPMLRAAFFTVGATGQYLGGWTPWSTTLGWPAGVGVKLPAGSRIAVELLHGPATPRPESQLELGLYAAEGATRPAADIVLQPDVARVKDGNGRVRSEVTLSSSGSLLSARVDMSASGRSIELRARRPDGSTEPLLLIRRFSQAWQSPYVFRRPVALPAGSIIQAVAYFDGSEPAPRLTVTVQADLLAARR